MSKNYCPQCPHCNKPIRDAMPDALRGKKDGDVYQARRYAKCTLCPNITYQRMVRYKVRKAVLESYAVCDRCKRTTA